MISEHIKIERKCIYKFGCAHLTLFQCDVSRKTVRDIHKRGGGRTVTGHLVH